MSHENDTIVSALAAKEAVIEYNAMTTGRPSFSEWLQLASKILEGEAASVGIADIPAGTKISSIEDASAIVNAFIGNGMLPLSKDQVMAAMLRKRIAQANDG